MILGFFPTRVEFELAVGSVAKVPPKAGRLEPISVRPSVHQMPQLLSLTDLGRSTTSDPRRV